MFGFEPIKYDEPRKLRTKPAVTDPSLKGVIWIVLLVLIFIGPIIGWGNLFATLIFVGCIKIVDLLWCERDYIRSAWPLFFGNYAAREAVEEENRRQFEAQMQSKSIEVTEAEIDEIDAMFRFMDDADSFGSDTETPLDERRQREVAFQAADR